MWRAVPRLPVLGTERFSRMPASKALNEGTPRLSCPSAEPQALHRPSRAAAMSLDRPGAMPPAGVLDPAAAGVLDCALPEASGYRRFALGLSLFLLLPPLLVAVFVTAVDPYYLFGSPSVPGLNVVRP